MVGDDSGTAVPSVVEDFFVPRSSCDCYECVGAEYRSEQGGSRMVANNMKHHTQLEACERCGRPKTEYKDLGRKGYYTCWWCEKRAADPGELEDES